MPRLYVVFLSVHEAMTATCTLPTRIRNDTLLQSEAGTPIIGLLESSNAKRQKYASS